MRVCVDARHGGVDDSMVLKIQGAIASRRYAGGGGGMSRSEGRGLNGGDSSLSSDSSETQVDVIFKVDDKYCFQIYFYYDSRLN